MLLGWGGAFGGGTEVVLNREIHGLSTIVFLIVLIFSIRIELRITLRRAGAMEAGALLAVT